MSCSASPRSRRTSAGGREGIGSVGPVGNYLDRPGAVSEAPKRRYLRAADGHHTIYTPCDESAKGTLLCAEVHSRACMLASDVCRARATGECMPDDMSIDALRKHQRGAVPPEAVPADCAGEIGA